MPRPLQRIGLRTLQGRSHHSEQFYERRELNLHITRERIEFRQEVMVEFNMPCISIYTAKYI
jgi:hypothetical protein